MRALILAAGRGSRMGDRRDSQPKCLLEVGGRALIEHQLETLADCGVGPVALVVGYRAEEIKEVVGIRAEYFHNNRWRNTNSMYSFWLAREWFTSDVMILNSDLLFSPEVIERLVRAQGDAIAIDSSSGRGAEQMKVQVADGRLVCMSKTLAQEHVAGENLGILLLREATALRVAEQAAQILEHNENDWLGAAVSEVAKDRPIEAVDVAGLPWGEIDFQVDLHRVRKSIWPAIRANSRERRWPQRLRNAAATLAGVVGLSLLINALVAVRPQPDWDPIDLAGLPTIELSSKEARQNWAHLAPGASADLVLRGPLNLRVDSRVMLAPGGTQGRYAVEIILDGTPLKWEDHLSEASMAWRTVDGGVAKRERVTLDVPDGEHRLQLRLVSPDPRGCLLRAAVSTPSAVEDD